jgi:altronate hydrolase
MPETVLQLDPRDNVLVALAPLSPGDVVRYGAESCPIAQAIPAKHKLALGDFAPGDLVYLYGMMVGEVVEAIPRGGLLTPRNVRHRAGVYTATRRPATIDAPDASAWNGRSFKGFHRADG